MVRPSNIILALGLGAASTLALWIPNKRENAMLVPRGSCCSKPKTYPSSSELHSEITGSDPSSHAGIIGLDTLQISRSHSIGSQSSGYSASSHASSYVGITGLHALFSGPLDPPPSPESHTSSHAGITGLVTSHSSRSHSIGPESPVHPTLPHTPPHSEITAAGQVCGGAAPGGTTPCIRNSSLG